VHEITHLSHSSSLPLSPPPPAGTPFRFRLNWGAGGKRLEAAPEFSIFVGDLAPDVTDQMLQDVFGEKFPSTLGAKVGREGGREGREGGLSMCV